MSFSVALFGECMIELQEMVPGQPQQSFGGDTLNTAVYMSRLGESFPAKIDYVTALGTDRFSRRMMEFWEAEGVGSSMVLQIDGQLPGLYYIDLDEKGERHFTYWRGQAAVKKCFEYEGSRQLLNNFVNYDLIYLSGISLAVLTPKSRNLLLQELANLNSEKTQVAFDYNYRPALWSSVEEALQVYRQILNHTDIVFAGSDELLQLHSITSTENATSFFSDSAVREWIIRNSAAPCIVWSKKRLHKIPLPAASNVVDTTAAGDSFSAAWLLARLQGKYDVKNATVIAHKMATYVIAHKGAIVPRSKQPKFTDHIIM